MPSAVTKRRPAPRAKRLPKHPAQRYAEDIVEGKAPASRYHRLACKRHLDDLKLSRTKGYAFAFDRVKADGALRFFSALKHFQGPLAGRPFVPEPWETFVISCIYGWVEKDTGLRRFRTVYLEVPKKSGKTFLASGLGLKQAFADGERGADVFFAATSRKQAGLAFDGAKEIVKLTALKKYVRIRAHGLSGMTKNNRLRPIASDAGNADGINPSAAIIDELHRFKSPELVNTITTSTAARDQPLVIEITTAGTDTPGIGRDHHNFSQRVLEGTAEHARWFALIMAIDPGDSWESEAVWRKVHPGLGVSVPMEKLRAEYAEAKESLSAQSRFRRFYLNEWVGAEEFWLDLGNWDGCIRDMRVDRLAGRECYAALDLGATQDTTAIVYYFPKKVRPTPEGYEGPAPKPPRGGYVLTRFFCPQERLAERSKHYGVPLDMWAEQKDPSGVPWVIPTPGNVTDYRAVKEQLFQDRERFGFDVKRLGFDRWNSSQVMSELQGEIGSEVDLVPIQQGSAHLSEATREVERLVGGRKLSVIGPRGAGIGGIRGNPVLRWQIGSAICRTDSYGNVSITKRSKSQTVKVDGVVALIMAVHLALQSLLGPGPSVYEERGIEFI